MPNKEKHQYNHAEIINSTGKFTLFIFLIIWFIGSMLHYNISWLNFFDLFFGGLMGSYLGEFLRRKNNEQG